MIFEPFNPGRCGNRGMVAPQKTTTSHAVPSAPVIQNAVRQPNASAMGVTSSSCQPHDPEAAPL